MKPRARSIGYSIVAFTFIYISAGMATAQTEPPAEEVITETPTAIPAPDAPDESTAMVTISKAENQKLQQAVDALRRENQRLTARRNQLLIENERQAAEIGLWRARLEHVLQCSSIAEAIEELKAVLTGQAQAVQPQNQSAPAGETP